MRSGLRGAIAGGLGVAALAGVAAAREVADARGPHAAVEARRAPTQPLRLLLLPGLDPSWAERVRGQLSDVAVQVVEVSPAAVRAVADPERRAQALARSRGADLVVWTEAEYQPAGSNEGPGTYVVIWRAPAGPPSARRLSGAWAGLGAADRSAALEIGALTVRSAVRGLAAERAAQAAVAPAPSPSAAPAPVEHGWQLGVALENAIDGQTDLGLFGITPQVGWWRERWSWYVGASFGLPASIDVAGVELRLRRHALLAGAGLELLAGPAFSLSAELRLNMVLNRRETRVGASQAVGTLPVSHWSLAVGAGAMARWHVSASHALGLSLGATSQLSVPRHIIEDPAGERTLEYALWHVQPTFGLGWLWRP